MSDQRLFDDETAGLVLRRAAEMQHESNVPVHGGDGLSAAELEQIATEAGIDPAFVRRAIAEAQVSYPETEHSPVFGEVKTLELVEEHCGASSSVLIRLEDGSLDFLCHRGWSGEETSDRLAAARKSEFIARAVAEGMVVNGFQPEETAPDDGPLVVAPLFDATGVVKALLCLDEIPATRLNESTIRVFLGIADWISSALARWCAALFGARSPRAKSSASACQRFSRETGPASVMSGLWIFSTPVLDSRPHRERSRNASRNRPQHHADRTRLWLLRSRSLQPQLQPNHAYVAVQLSPKTQEQRVGVGVQALACSVSLSIIRLKPVLQRDPQAKACTPARSSG